VYMYVVITAEDTQSDHTSPFFLHYSDPLIFILETNISVVNVMEYKHIILWSSISEITNMF
jgi:hypothetical protein